MSKKKSSKQSLKIVRWAFTLIILLLSFYLAEFEKDVEIKSDSAPVIYASICRDNLEEIFVRAIQEAKRSVVLVIYSLTDSRLIHALNQQASKGISVRVIRDTTTPSFGFEKLMKPIDMLGIKMSGLMHQKILIIDEEKIWLGSANMTVESLKLHDNLIIGLINSQLAEAIEQQQPHKVVECGGQKVEYWAFPQKGKEGTERLIQLIDSSKVSIKIAMFTWTHHALAEAVIRAHQRGIHVEIVMDRGQANGVCQDIVHKLFLGGIPVRVNTGLGLLHHKLAWIDEKILVNGSANWTAAAFSRNRDCFLILHALTDAQNNKLKLMWSKTLLGSHEFELFEKLAA